MNKRQEPLKIAFYGKGGIGKSTISANVSAAFSTYGCKALHIGCDPKADSARCLMGRKIPTVMQLLQEKAVGVEREDVVFQGFGGISCIEAGGPEAGIGCAGRGIISMMEEYHFFKGEIIKNRLKKLINNLWNFCGKKCGLLGDFAVVR